MAKVAPFHSITQAV